MRVSIISHSNVSARQRLFWEYFSKFCYVSIISPTSWGTHVFSTDLSNDHCLKIGVDVLGAGDLRNYLWSEQVLYHLQAYQPDLVYVQNEWYCASTKQVVQWCKELKVPYALFCWENLNSPNDTDKEIINNAIVRIGGNRQACAWMNTDVMLPQVGVSTSLFKKDSSVVKDINVMYCGRPVKEKGTDLIQQAYPETVFVSGRPYTELPSYYNRSRLLVNFPLKTQYWTEQYAPFSVVEGMLCGTPIISSDSGSIKDWLNNSPAVILPEGDVSALKTHIASLLQNPTYLDELGNKCSMYASKNYTDEVISKKLIKVFIKSIGGNK